MSLMLYIITMVLITGLMAIILCLCKLGEQLDNDLERVIRELRDLNSKLDKEE